MKCFGSKSHLLTVFCLLCIVLPANIFGEENQDELKTVSGFIVPANMSHWTLSGKVDFSKDGTDIGFNFANDLADSLKGSIIIYPGKKDPAEAELKKELNQLLSVTLKNQKKYKILLTDIGTKSQNSKKYPMSFAIFEYEINNIPLSSYLIIVHVDKWVIEYRVSFEPGLEKTLGEEIQTFLTGIQYPE